MRQMDIERGKPMREDAILSIFSMSKPVTAVAVMRLAEEGLIGLDDAVDSHIPAWKNLGGCTCAAQRGFYDNERGIFGNTGHDSVRW
jgi:CubicO group peptidase (beta-lactamase class C family)